MEQQILDALTAKFPGVDAKTLSRIAKKLAKTAAEGADAKTIADGVTIQQLMENYGDARATEAGKTAVTNYEKEHKLKDGKPIEEPAPNPNPDPKQKPGEPEMPEYMKAFMAKMESLEKTQQALLAEKLGNTRKQKLGELLKDAPENVRKMYEANFDNMQFADDAAFDTWCESNKTIIETMTADYVAKGGVVHKPMGNNKPTTPEVNPALKANVDARKAQPAVGGSAIILGLPTNN